MLNIDGLFMSERDRKLENFKHLLQRIASKTESRLTEFHVTEGYYVSNRPELKEVGVTVINEQPLSGKALVYLPDHSKEDASYVVVSLNELQEIVNAYKDALDFKD